MAAYVCGLLAPLERLGAGREACEARPDDTCSLVQLGIDVLKPANRVVNGQVVVPGGGSSTRLGISRIGMLSGTAPAAASPSTARSAGWRPLATPGRAPSRARSGRGRSVVMHSCLQRPLRIPTLVPPDGGISTISDWVAALILNGRTFADDRLINASRSTDQYSLNAGMARARPRPRGPGRQHLWPLRQNGSNRPGSQRTRGWAGLTTTFSRAATTIARRIETFIPSHWLAICP